MRGIQLDTIGLAVGIAVGGLFMMSGLAKLRAGTFASDLANYRILPRRWVVPAATILPWIELTVGIATLLSPSPAPFLLSAGLLLSAFTAGIVTNLLRGRRISCGCRGAAKPITWGLVATNVTWGLAAVVTAAAAGPGAVPTLLGISSEVSASEGAAVIISVTLAALIVRLTGSLRRVLSVLARVSGVEDLAPAT